MSSRDGETPQPSWETNTDAPDSPDTQDEMMINDTLDYQSAFELTGVGNFSYLVLFSCLFIFLHAITEMVAFAYVADSVECDIDLSVLEKTLVGIAVFFGIVMSAVCWGSLTDHVGRKKVMLPAIICAMICSTISSFADSFWMMLIFRFFVGVSISASSATVFVYLGELESSKTRDKYIAIVVMACSVTFILFPAIGWLIIPKEWSFPVGNLIVRPWRVFMWLWNIPGILGLISLIFLPESPSFVFSHYQNEIMTLKILTDMYHQNTNKDATTFPVHHIRRLAEITDPDNRHTFKDALKEMSLIVRYPLWRPFIVTHYCMFITFMLDNGVYLWIPSIYNILLQDISLPYSTCDAIKSKYNMSSDEDIIHFEEVFLPHVADVDCSTFVINTLVYPLSIMMEIVLAIPFLVVTLTINKVNKCHLYIYLIAPLGIYLLICALVPNLIAAGIFLTLGVCAGSAASILSALIIEAFPTKLRALAMCTMYMMGHIGAITGNTLVSIGAGGPCIAMFTIIALLTSASVVIMKFMWPDIQEVRDIMESRNFPY